MMEEINTPIEENEPKRRSRTIGLAGIILAAFLVGLGAGYVVWAVPLTARAEAAEAQAAEAQAASAQQSQTAQNVQRYDVPVDDDPILGPEDAKITIIEFSDYECPYCRRWHQEVFPQIQEKYGDQVRFVYRDFPLYSIHPNAGPAAEAANCAGEQDAYWEFNHLVYAATEELSSSLYEQFAEEIGLNMESFKICVTEQRYKSEVDADYEYASQLGVRSTPTFFINGLAVVGAQPFEVFERIIDMELAGEIP